MAATRPVVVCQNTGPCLAVRHRSQASNSKPWQLKLVNQLPSSVRPADQPAHALYASLGIRSRGPCSPSSSLRSNVDSFSEYSGVEDGYIPAPSSKGRTVVNGIYTGKHGAAWRIRPYVKEDKEAVVRLQTDGFHESVPLPIVNNLLYKNFEAEVLDALKQKLAQSQTSYYQILVAEELRQPATGAEAGDSQSSSPGHAYPMPYPHALSNSSPDDRKPGAIVGVVEVSIQDLDEVLWELRWKGADDYCYISSMAVAHSVRRIGLATALIQAAEMQAQLWRQQHLALHVYEDNMPAIALYSNNGMQTLAKDPFWKAVVGGRIRLLMYKQLEMQ